MEPTEDDTRSLVKETIKSAKSDVPEVSQVKWAAFKGCWVTSADDDVIRLWSPQGEVLESFSYPGGSVSYMFVDNQNERLLFATASKHIYVYELQSNDILGRYSGHRELVRGLGYLRCVSAST